MFHYSKEDLCEALRAIHESLGSGGETVVREWDDGLEDALLEQSGFTSGVLESPTMVRIDGTRPDGRYWCVRLVNRPT